MWLQELLTTAAESPPPAPPDVPFEQVGIVLVALVTGITGIIVALIQRGKPKPPDAAPSTVTGGPPPAVAYVIPKEDWEKVRDGFIRIDAQVAQIRSDYDYHERLMIGEVRELDNEISRMKGHLGLQ